MNNLPFLCFIVAFCVIILGARSQSYVGNALQPIRTRNGDVQGKLVMMDGQAYPVYLAIPFAEPPVGRLRFQNPVPVRSWAPRILRANGTFSKTCVQNGARDSMSEDCLYLNVFTSPQSRSGSGIFHKLRNGRGGGGGFPVMFWIHGGAFVAGSASEYPVEGILKNLVSRGVVVVTINYRLGSLGFWTSKTSSAPGNFGFLDQVMALQWTRDNIRSFGGDPNRITLFGESAGGASVSILTLSPTSQNMFQQAIMQSGSGLALWAVKADVVGDESDQLADILRCSRFVQTSTNGNNGAFGARNYGLQDNMAATLQCMQSKSVEEIQAAELAVKPFLLVQWAGRVDGRFLPDTPKKLAERRPRINVIAGCTKDEWGLFEFLPSGNGPPSPVSSAQQLNASIPDYVTDSLFFNAESVRYLVQNQFIDSVQYQAPSYGADTFWLNQSVQMKSGELFWAPGYADAVSYADRYPGSVYLYSLDYLSPNQMKGQQWRGVVHGTDIFYIFNSGLPPRNEGELNLFGDIMGPSPEEYQDTQVAELIQTFWTNFAKYGYATESNPTPRSVSGSFTWDQFRSNERNYCSIDRRPSMKRGFHTQVVDFWNTVLRSYRMNL